jgi:hypothetical protein
MLIYQRRQPRDGVLQCKNICYIHVCFFLELSILSELIASFLYMNFLFKCTYCRAKGLSPQITFRVYCRPWLHAKRRIMEFYSPTFHSVKLPIFHSVKL